MLIVLIYGGRDYRRLSVSAFYLGIYYIYNVKEN